MMYKDPSKYLGCSYQSCACVVKTMDLPNYDIRCTPLLAITEKC